MKSADDILFEEKVGDLQSCKEKCLEIGPTCRYVIHGWNQGKDTWCIVLSRSVNCLILDQGPKDCGSSGSNGVHTYEYSTGASKYAR